MKLNTILDITGGIENPIEVHPHRLEIDEELKTYNHFIRGQHCKAYHSLLCASHWVDPDTGESVKLSQNLKAVYHYRLGQYNSFNEKGALYYESNQRIADMLCININTITLKINPLLKRMGLLQVHRQGLKEYYTEVYPLDRLNGVLINKKLPEYNITQDNDYKTPDNAPRNGAMTTDQWETYQSNLKLIKLLRNNLTRDFNITMDKDNNL